MYVYSSLPKINGINSADHGIIIWKEEVDMRACIFSRLVQCQKIPMSVTLAKLSCLRQLLDDKQAATNWCYITRSTNIEQDIMQVDDEFWLFLNIRRAERCQVYSNSNNLIELISINEPSLVNIQCNETIVCMDFQIGATSCMQRRAIVTPHSALHSRPQSRVLLPIRNMSRTITSSYRLQQDIAIHELMTALASKKSVLKKIFEDFLMYILACFSVILIPILPYPVKLIKQRLQKQMNSLENILEDIISV